jgi:roadblock/LC7 domain-containing protein
MNWSDLAAKVGKFAPLVGTLLGGPAGAAVGGLVASVLGTEATPDAVNVALATNPEAAVKIQELQSAERTRLNELLVEAEKARLVAATEAAKAVNATMQAEAGASHWPTYTWRPFIGFAVGINVIVSSFLTVGVFAAVVLGAVQAAAAVAALPTVLGALAAINGTVLPILGIASWFRGKAQADPSIPTDNRG